MIALTQKDVLAHAAVVPWPKPCQIEQDLLLRLAMRAIFEDRFLSSEVAMRGGTVLHKVHLAPAARYSEDIDLVAVGDRPEGHIRYSWTEPCPQEVPSEDIARASALIPIAVALFGDTPLGKEKTT